MARVTLEEPRPAAASLTDYERTHVIRRLPAEKDRRYRELAEKQSLGPLTSSERAELHRLADESERLSLENAQSLLRHRDPAAFAALQERIRAAERPPKSTPAKPQHT